jgi:hypothetical protein
MRSYVKAVSGLDGQRLDAVVRRFGLDGGHSVGPEKWAFRPYRTYPHLCRSRWGLLPPCCRP